MPGRSTKTQVVSIRLPTEVIDVIRRRVDNGWDSVSQYVRNLVTYEVMRNHHRRKNAEVRE